MRFSEGSPIRFPAVFSEGSPVGLPAAFSEESPVRLLAEDLTERKKGMNRQEDTRRKTDYRIYRLSLPEVAVCLILYLGLVGIISFLYYNSPLPILIAAPGGVAALRVFRSRCIEKRQRQLYVEFKDMVQSLAASMGAGYAFENAFTAAYEEMRKLYGDSGLIVKELKWVIHCFFFMPLPIKRRMMPDANATSRCTSIHPVVPVISGMTFLSISSCAMKNAPNKISPAPNPIMI